VTYSFVEYTEAFESDRKAEAAMTAVNMISASQQSGESDVFFSQLNDQFDDDSCLSALEGLENDAERNETSADVISNRLAS
jgi:hypothetical protein